jgi:hypothetical protein
VEALNEKIFNEGTLLPMPPTGRPVASILKETCSDGTRHLEGTSSTHHQQHQQLLQRQHGPAGGGVGEVVVERQMSVASLKAGYRQKLAAFTPQQLPADWSLVSVDSSGSGSSETGAAAAAGGTSSGSKGPMHGAPVMQLLQAFLGQLQEQGLMAADGRRSSSSGSGSGGAAGTTTTTTTSSSSKEVADVLAPSVTQFVDLFEAFLVTNRSLPDVAALVDREARSRAEAAAAGERGLGGRAGARLTCEWW